MNQVAATYAVNARSLADKSPMENHHLAAAFEVLLQPEYNCLKHLSKTQWDKLRKLIIDLVLSTE